MNSYSEEHRSNPALGEWVPTALLGPWREYDLYLALHHATGTPVHLRVLNPDADAIARKRFLAEVEIASKHHDHFLRVLTMQSKEGALIAVCEAPVDRPNFLFSGSDMLVVARVCLQLAEALQILHAAGWVHGALCSEAVEIVEVEEPWVRLRDIGMGLEIGRTYSGLKQPNLPFSALGVATASPHWDVYSLGILGLQITESVECRAAQDDESAALRAIFMACIAEPPKGRPISLKMVWDCLNDIVMDCENPRAASPGTSSLSCHFSVSELQWFVEDSLSQTQAASIEDSASKAPSTWQGILTMLFSLAAGAMVALIVAMLVVWAAFGR